MESHGWNYGIAKRKLQAFKRRVVSHKNKIDRCLRYHAKVLECATVKRGNVVKELENVREENRRLDRDITALGLFYRSKMLQLKLRYQMEIIDVMAELELDITAWTITQRKAILKLQELMELRRRIEGYLIHVHFLLKAISDHEARLSEDGRTSEVRLNTLVKFKAVSVSSSGFISRAMAVKDLNLVFFSWEQIVD